MLSNLIVLSEFRYQPRRRGFYGMRMAVTGIAALILLVGYLRLVLGRSGEAGLVLFFYLEATALGLAMLVGPYVAGMPLAEEQRRRTLDVLCLTDLSLGQVVVGRMIGGMMQLGVLVGAVLPMILLSVSLGGVRTEQILAGTVLLLGTMTAAVGVGLLAGAICREEGRVQVWAPCLALILFVGVQGGGMYAVESFLGAEGDWLCTIATLGALRTAEALELALANFGVNAGLALPMVLVAMVAINRQVYRAGARAQVLPARWRGQSRIQPAGGDWLGRPAAVKQRPNDGPDLMMYKDLALTFGYGGRTWLIMAGLTVLLCGTLQWQVGSTRPAVVGWWAYYLAVAVVIVYAAQVVVRCHQSLRNEVLGGTLDLILTTRMDPADLLSGKLRAALLSSAPYLVMGAALVLQGSLLLANSQPEEVVFWLFVGILALPVALLMIDAYTWMTFWMVLNVRRHSLLLALSLLPVWLVGGTATIAALSFLCLNFAGIFTLFFIPIQITRYLRDYLGRNMRTLSAGLRA